MARVAQALSPPLSLFSQRLPWHLPPNQLSQLLVEKRQAGRRVLDLTISNPTAALPELYTTTDLLAALTDPAGLRYQPSPRGDLRARQAIAGYYARRELAVDPEHLVLCASTSEAYSWLFQLLCDPGQRVLFPQPSYPLLAFLGGLSSVEVAPYSLDFDGDRWRIDLASLREQLTPETRAVVLVSPNNPTGSLVHTAEWQELRALGREHRLALIVDEVFGDYRLDPDCDAADPALGSALLDDSDGPLCFVLSGLSKVLGLPQLKLGWIHVGGGEPLRTEAQDRLEIVADTFLSVGTPVQLAAPQLLGEQPRLSAAIQERTGSNLHRLRRQLKGTALSVLPAEGGWYATVRLPRLCSEQEWVETLLREDDVLCHPGYFFDFTQEAFVILSLLTAPAELDEGVARLLRRVTELEKVR